jgi:hypothetical protein
MSENATLRMACGFPRWTATSTASKQTKITPAMTAGRRKLRGTTRTLRALRPEA